jgi:hypothetical protein
MATSNIADNTVLSTLFRPLLDALTRALPVHVCPALPDEIWLRTGVLRCLHICQSGRDLLQALRQRDGLDIGLSTFFASLQSTRRLRLATAVNERLCRVVADTIADPFADVEGGSSLESYDLYAGDGHFHEASCHDRRRVPVSAPSDGGEAEAKKYPTGHLYALNLRSGALSHLTMADQEERCREHDMHALKRLGADALRHGAGKGRKVLYVWDRAGLDFRQWHHWKGQGIYFLSRSKDNMALETVGENRWKSGVTGNRGVESDQLVSTSQGVAVRRVIYRDTVSGRRFEFLTNLPVSVPPGLVALLYRRRWDIEKAFDQIKNKMGEARAWAQSATAKTNQAQFICMTHNLLLLVEHQAAVDGVVNTAEMKRRQQETSRLKERLRARGLALPPFTEAFQRLTVRTVKFIRWVRLHLHPKALWQPSLRLLAHEYARL